MKNSTLSGHSILIVDDSEELLEVLSIVLEKHGHKVIIEKSPGHISNFVQANKIDLLLLDIMLGNDDGRIICKELKSNPLTNYFPIILMSVMYDFFENFSECEADGFIEKPFDLHFLMEKINECLKKEAAG